MPTIEKHAPGSFCWVELSTSDQIAAKSFYGSLFGWGADDMPMGPGDFYTTFKLNGRAAGAAYTIRPEEKSIGIPPHWNLYIAVADADDATHRAVLLGGKVLAAAFDVFDVGRMAIVQDPTGAIFQVWQAKNMPGMGIQNEPGTFCWADLSTGDRIKAKQFYQDMFGWKMDPGQGKTDQNGYLHIKNGEHYIAGILPDTHRNPSAPPHWMPYFAVSSADETAAKAKGMGGQVYMGPMNVDQKLRIAILADPQGAVFALFEAGHPSGHIGAANKG